MFKYITFAALFAIAIATAAPGFIAQPVVAKVGAVVHTVPSATSHQSITQVHNNAHIVTPIVKAVAPVVHVAPVVKTYSAPVVPVVKTYSAPVVHHVPVVKSVVAPIVPVVHTVPVAPIVHH
ncbi:uncharacterized protein LOC120778039 [Bactrocera tryoni]|uniref:uncharacterized protein LOC120778039 n=1 Tax=Bactrocera tryoni TaxID=59916 RepID=UPI001A991A60|nr:uncharacterized protein LOC120778039 [Bactrocera tryoni]